MLLNLTNHPSANWDLSQLNAAKERWNTILDMPFPNVPPDFDDEQIMQSAEAIVKKAIQLHPDAVLCQGEMTMVFSFVHMFHLYGIPSYAATTYRQSKEIMKEDGTMQKQSVFHFVKFRKYSMISSP